jgi:hypothetical protein
MRLLALIFLTALALPSAALAQGRSAGGGTPIGDLMDLNRFATRGVMNQWSATRPTALSGLSQASRRWIKTQVQLQAIAPRTPLDVMLDIDKVIGEDVRRVAKDERVHPDDVAGAVLLKIMSDTRNALAREARKAPVEEAQAWQGRISRADVNLRESVEMQSSISLALARD